MMSGYVQNLTTNTLAQIGANQLSQVENGLQDKTKIVEAAKDFEAVFITQMLQHMYAGIKTDGPFGGGHAEETWRSVLLDEYGKTVSQSGGIGIAEHVQRELLRLQEV